MTKTEFYNQLASLTKKTGQGLELNFARMIPGFNQEMLDELIEDGLVHMFSHPGGYLPGEDWICLTGIYNVESVNKRDSIQAYAFMRYYLGIIKEGDQLYPLAKETPENIIANSIDVYKEFLMKNLEGLEAIKRIKTDNQFETTMNDQTVDFLKSRDWYKDNKSIKDCIKVCEDANHSDEEDISINNQIINLCIQGEKLYPNKYIGDKEKNIAEIEERNIRLKNRKRLLNIMNDCEEINNS